MKWALLLLIALVVVVSVSGEDHGTQGISGACDPLDPEVCWFPYPNNFWTVLNDDTDTGLQLNLTKATMPKGALGAELDPVHWNTLDGWSLSVAALSSWGPDVDLSNVPPHWDISQSLQADSATVFIDYQTGDLIPHWGELDMSSGDGDTSPTFMIWPAQSLGNNRHVIVAIRDLKNAKTGKLYEPSDAFRSLRDGTPSSDPLVNQRREYYEGIFKVLEEAGIARDSLQLAWDYTTASRQAVNGWVLEMRTNSRKQLKDPMAGPQYYITDVEENVSEYTARRIKGKMSIPLYLTSSLPAAILVIEDNKPAFQGFANYTFTVQIPKSLVENGTTGGLMHYGHGLFGTQREVQSSYLQKFGYDHGLTTYATDWVGMASYDVPSVVAMLSGNLANFRIIPDGLSQAMVNHLLLTDLMTGAFPSDPTTIFNGKPTIDPSKGVFYHGNSNGGILGTVYMSLEQTIERGCVGVPGGPYALLLPRSVDFDEFRVILELRWKGSYKQMFLIDFIQSLWDRAAPGGYMHLVTKETFEDTPRKQMIVHDGLHDSQVSYIGGAVLARSMGAHIFTGQVRDSILGKPAEVYGFPEIPAGGTISGPGAVYQTYWFNTPWQPETNIPPGHDCDVHECPRRDSRAEDMHWHLFDTGHFKNFCSDTDGCIGREFTTCGLNKCPFVTWNEFYNATSFY